MPDARKPDPLTARLGAGGHVVISGQLPALHPAAIVDHRERRLGCVDHQENPAGPGVQRVGEDFGQDRFFERPGIGIAKVFEQVLQIDASLAHRRNRIAILARA